MSKSLSCNAHDSESFWPLLCYELSIGIDQEETLLQGFERCVFVEYFFHMHCLKSIMLSIISESDLIAVDESLLDNQLPCQTN